MWDAAAVWEPRVVAATRLLVFLDYDGTLTPIAPHPSVARLPARTKQVLDQLSRQPLVGVALISGRAVRDLRRMVGLRRLCYVGNHGLELQGPKLRYVNPVAQASRPLLRRLRRQLRAAVRGVPGAWVEDKRLTLSVHLRLVPLVEQAAVQRRVDAVVSPHQQVQEVQVTVGKHVLEIRPPVRWHKGTIVTWLLARQRALAGGKGLLPIYVGDDQTDEDAFAALQGHGLTVRVGVPVLSSDAEYRVETPNDVHRLLVRLLTLRTTREARDAAAARP